jgi:hypothetical protein
MLLKSLGKYRDYAPVTLRVMLGLRCFSPRSPEVMSPNRWNERAVMAKCRYHLRACLLGVHAGFMETLAGFASGSGSRFGDGRDDALGDVRRRDTQRCVGCRTARRKRHPVDFAAGALALLLLGGRHVQPR